jgi:hypothetical protein
MRTALTLDQHKAMFDSNVFPEPNTGCWLWAGRHDNKGYGRIHGKSLNIQLAHRFSYFIYKEDPKGQCCLHTCDNPACVNPDHLYLGDQKQNNIDRDTRGRQVTQHGTNHKLAKLTDDQVQQIRALHNPKEYPSRRLAKMFGVSQKLIMNILQNKAWSHLLP